MRHPFQPSISKVLIAGAALLVIAALGWLGYRSFGPPPGTIKGFAIGDVEKNPRPEFQVTGVFDSPAIRAELFLNGKTVPMSYEAGKISLPQSEYPQVLPPYDLHISVPAENGDDYDFVINIGRQGLYFRSIAAGFTPESWITVYFADQLQFDKVRFDWSGRVNVNTQLNDPVPMPTCVYIGQGEKEIGSVCHSFLMKALV